MASSILRRIVQKGARNVLGSLDPIKKSLLRVSIDPATTFPLRGLMHPIQNFLQLKDGLIESKNPSISSSSPPLLMLPPFYEGNDYNILNFKFYNFAQDTIQLVPTQKEGILVNNNIKFVSSSHGWLALFNRSNCDLFLFNPFSGRQIKLPPIHTLDVSENNPQVNKVITSCSPEEEADCRVMMSFGPHQRLAFCSPASSKWTPIGDLYYKDEDDSVLEDGYHRADYDKHPSLRYFLKLKWRNHPTLRGYQDFVYSTTKNIFYCIDTHMGFESWDLDTWYPKACEFNPSLDLHMYPWPVKSLGDYELKNKCKHLTFLVVAEETGDIFWVMRHVLPHTDLRGMHVYCREENAYKYPYKTIGFDVHKYDQESDALVYMDGSLDRLAFFIGNNHSFAISPSGDIPEIQPNSIYFTDVNELIPENHRSYGGHDIGVFDYENQTISPTCSYPSDRQNITRITPPPMWFTRTD